MEQFNDIVRRYFGPQIDEYGLLPGGEGRYWVEFSSPRASLWIDWDALRTGEVATSIAPLYDKDDRYYGFAFELYLILRFKKDNPELIRGGPVRPEQLDEELRRRAALMQKYCGKLLDGDIDEFDKLKKHIRMDSHEYTWRTNRRTITLEAEKAWAAADYDRVVRLVSSYEDLLDPDWRQKLAAARSAVRAQKQ